MKSGMTTMSSKLIRVVNLKSEPYDVYIGRSGQGLVSKWGNPFRIGKDGDRDTVISKYRDRLWPRIKDGKIKQSDLLSLKGKTLGCFCKPQPCHGDVIAEAVLLALEQEFDDAP